MKSANGSFEKSYKKLITSHILITIFMLNFILVSRVAINGGPYPVFVNVLFVILYIGNLCEFYQNYKFIIDNNYKIYTKASRNLVIILMIISVIFLLITEIFGNRLWQMLFF